MARNHSLLLAECAPFCNVLKNAVAAKREEDYLTYPKVSDKMIYSDMQTPFGISGYCPLSQSIVYLISISE